jgi:hypothetical protein
MDMFRTLKIGTITALTATAGLLTGCLQAPEYPAEPHIDFKEVRADRYNFGGGQTPVDTVRITIDFTDGDGDLGLAADEVQAPYNPSDAGGNYNRTTDNYFITAYKRANATLPFEVVTTGSAQGYNSRFPKLFSDEAKAGPLKGSLTLTLPLFLGSPFRPGEEVRFDVSIMDRALHESNKITTSSYIVQPR